MSQNPYQAPDYRIAQIASQATVDERVSFIRNTYLHLFGAVLGFVAITASILTIFGEQLEGPIALVTRGWHWLIFLGFFMAVSWVADHWARSNTSRGLQYFGLSLYVFFEAILFIPLLYIADKYFPGTIQSAGIVTAIVFAGLTATVFITKADFSFLRMVLMLASFSALAVIVVSMLVGWQFSGIWFSIAMIVLASGYILYDTSNVLHHYRTDQHVAASLALFASVALLFWYVLQLFMNRD